MKGILVLIVIPFLLPVYNASGIPMFYGGFFGSHGEWTKLIDTNAAIFWSQGDFQHRPWEVEDIHQLADHGVKINYRVYWWHAFHNGEIAWNTSVVDIYYNATLMKLLEEHIDWQLSQLNADEIWAVTLSEEEPAGAFCHFSGSKLQNITIRIILRRDSGSGKRISTASQSQINGDLKSSSQYTITCTTISRENGPTY